ncbi:MAG TPA: ATP phosphoribosyltransferase regulatory subunit [Hyphomicrobiales bacterium]|nr:ATP phosphoribosyltransferase regulatory subunit [Hyphomicrobiales bacterium]
MSAASNGAGPSERARALCARFSERGFSRIEPAILQPAELFVGLSGEDIRRRLYLVSDPSGVEYCLRPDFTIPVARAYLDEAAPTQARYCYAGPAFRFRRAGAGAAQRGEFQQAGVEIFGARNGEAAELEMLELAFESVLAEAPRSFELRLGDPGLFADILDRLDLPESWRRRLRRHFWRRDVAEDLAQALAEPKGNGNRAALATALAGLDGKAAAELVEEVLALAGILPVGGRTAEEIAGRFMERAGTAAPAACKRAIAVVRKYLSIEGEPLKAIKKVRALVKAEKLGLEDRVDGLERRLVAIQAMLKKMGAAGATFDAEFGRRLEFYTGLVFEMCDPERPEMGQIAGGGRYDQLLVDLGAKRRIPAVGCAIYVDRLIEAGAGS